jgi:hypothetical protein
MLKLLRVFIFQHSINFPTHSKISLNIFKLFSNHLLLSSERARMVGERDREQDAVRWELDDTAAISIPPPFNNGILQYNQHQQQHYAAMAAASAAEDMSGRWEDEQNYNLMGGDGMGGLGTSTTEKGVRFPTASPTHGGFSNGQLSQEPLQRTHSRY